MAVIHTQITVHRPVCDTCRAATCCCGAPVITVAAEFNPGRGDIKSRITRAREAARAEALRIANRTRP